MELTAKKIADALLEGPVLVVHDGRFPTHDLFAAARDALPRPADAERAEIKEIYESVGLEAPKGRPYRAPHYSAGVGGVLGTSRKLADGTVKVYPGEVTLAHSGLLVLYDSPEFRRDVLEAIYASYKSGRAAVPMAGGGVAKLLAGFYLLGDMVACPCGKYGHPSCACTNDQIVRYHERARRTIGWETVIYQDAVQPNPCDLAADRDFQKKVAETIVEQLGGRNRLHAMLGPGLVTHYGRIASLHDRTGLIMKWGRGRKANVVQIAYNVGSDLYDMSITVPGYEAEYIYDVEASQLKPIIEDQTGYFLSLR